MKHQEHRVRRGRRNTRRAICLALLFLVAGCAQYPIIPTPPIVEGWGYAELPRTYDRETLFQHINGKARSYLDYGFVKLDHVQFAPPEGQPVIDVHVYDMGSPMGAFGIYSLERGDDLPRHYRKRLGYMIDSARLFWKGRHYVTITSPDRSPETIEVINALSIYMEKSVPGDSEDISLLAAFPAEEKVPDSEQYFAINLMGHEFMGGGFVASYQEKGRRFRLFLSPKDSPETAAKAYQALREAISDYGKAVAEVEAIGESTFVAEGPYLGNWLVSLSGNYVAGAVGFQDELLARKLLTCLCTNLPPSAASGPSTVKPRPRTASPLAQKHFRE